MGGRHGISSVVVVAADGHRRSAGERGLEHIRDP